MFVSQNRNAGFVRHELYLQSPLQLFQDPNHKLVHQRKETTMETTARGLRVSRFDLGFRDGHGVLEAVSTHSYSLLQLHIPFFPRSLFHSRIYCAGLMPTEKERIVIHGIPNIHTRHTRTPLLVAASLCYMIFLFRGPKSQPWLSNKKYCNPGKAGWQHV